MQLTYKKIIATRLHEFAPQIANLLEAYTPPSRDDIFKTLMGLVNNNRGEFKSLKQKNFLLRAMGADANDPRVKAEFFKTDRYAFGEFGGAVRDVHWAIYCDATGVTLVTCESARGVETHWKRSQEYFDDFEQKAIQKQQRAQANQTLMDQEELRVWQSRIDDWQGRTRPGLQNNIKDYQLGTEELESELSKLPPERAALLSKYINKELEKASNAKSDIARLDKFYQQVQQLVNQSNTALLAAIPFEYCLPWVNQFGSVDHQYRELFDQWQNNGQWWPRIDQPNDAPATRDKIPAPGEPTTAGNSVKNSNQFLGEIGKKLPPTDVTVTAVRSAYGAYGHSYGYVMRDTEGNTLMWWTAKEVFKQGDTAQITGTVKDHTVFNGTNQTVLKLVKKA